MDETDLLKVGIIIPTYNGGDLWSASAENIYKQKKENNIQSVLVIDSGSKDHTNSVSKKYDFELQEIDGKAFNHGGTRNLGVRLINKDIVIFLTQDAIPQDNAFKNILALFKDPLVAAVYGRQIPHDNASPIAKHARYFNYKLESYVTEEDSLSTMGLKTVFMSNSFSAYRVKIFNELGGFPENTILGEDMYFAAKAYIAGYKLAYASDAIVKHSHNYSPLDEYKRYFDIGVFHRDEKWIREKFGGAGGEGRKFIISELKFLSKKNALWIPLACMNNFCKIIGYKMGQNYHKLSLNIVRKLSMHNKYW